MREGVYHRPEFYPAQEAAIFAPQRYKVVEASTKAGKTVGALAWIIEQAIFGKSGRNYWWVAPVYPQAKIAFRRLRRNLEFFQGDRGDLWSFNESELFAELANGSRIWFKSGEKPDNLYGEDVYGVVIDEASRVREEAWHAVRSTLTATRGEAVMIGNVKGTGNWFYQLAREAQRGDDPDLHYAKLTWEDAVDAGVLDRAEIDDARRRLPEPVFRELYEAVAADLEGRIYYCYDPDENVVEVEDVGGELYAGMDFNVDPMSAVLGVKAADELHILDEIEIRNSGTEEMASEILARIATAEWVALRERPVVVCPDPSGSARRTSAPVGQTDFTILERHGFGVRADKMAPPVADRINEVNAMLRSADGRRRLLIHPRCRSLQRSLEYHCYKEGTSIPDKEHGFDHLNDALGYLVHQEFPIVEQGTWQTHKPRFW